MLGTRAKTRFSPALPALRVSQRRQKGEIVTRIATMHAGVCSADGWCWWWWERQSKKRYYTRATDQVREVGRRLPTEAMFVL